LIIINVAFNSYLSFNCLLSEFHGKKKIVNHNQKNIEDLNDISFNFNNKINNNNNNLKDIKKNLNSNVFVHVQNLTFSSDNFKGSKLNNF